MSADGRQMSDTPTDGYKVLEILECQWKEQKKASKEIQDFLKVINLVPQLNPRDAFCGGRTGAASLYYKANTDEGEKSDTSTSPQNIPT